MASRHSVLLLATLHGAAFASFAPFPLHHFGETAATTGARRFSHTESHIIDGSALTMRWNAHVDPDTILALDGEHHEAGVRIVSCSPTQLVLQLPATHVAQAKALTWRHITASDEIHGCAHLVDHPLYHRIESMEFTKHPETPKGGATVVFSTKELYTVGQILPNVDFDYDVTPIDSLHPDEQEAARDYYDQQQLLAGADEYAAKSDRRLTSTWSMPKQPGFAKDAFTDFEKGFKKSIGKVTIESKLRTKDKHQFKHWKPMTHAKFGWNWNFHANSTRNPQFKFTLPGMRGYVLLKNPYMKFLGKFSIKFKSKWNDKNPFAEPPHVKMKTKFKGNAFINADLSLMSNIYRDVGEDPLGRFHIPLLNNFTKETHYFNRVKFFIANIPIMLQPGVSVNLNAYHLGLFKGSVRLGINVQLRVKAEVKYDSKEGMKAEFNAQALNVKLLPPTWMIYTKHLEFGALLTPSFWIKGGFGPVKDITVELQLRPYCNVSVTQEGEATYGVQQQVMEKELVVMPFRAINLDLGSEWSVGIQANGRRKMTSTELSLGVVEFNDYVEHFRFGLIDQRRLLRDPIYVVLFKNGVQQVGKVVPIYCESVVEGECQPAPFNAEFYVNMKTVIVQLTLAWHTRPVDYLMSKVRSMSLVFPQLALSREASTEFVTNPPEKVFVKVTRNGREVRNYQKPQTVGPNNLILLTGNQTQDLGISWLDAWRVNYGSISGQKSVTRLIDPSVELFYIRNGIEIRVAQTFLPAINWEQVLTNTQNAKLDNWLGAGSGVGRTGPSGAFGGVGGQGHATSDIETKEEQQLSNPEPTFLEGYFEGNVPLQISLGGHNGGVYATGHMGLDVHYPENSNRWLFPHKSEKFVQGVDHMLYWATRSASPTVPQSFSFIAFKVDPLSGSFTPTSMKMELANLVCSMTNNQAQRFMSYGKECVYSQKLQVDPGLVGVTVVFQVRFQDIHDRTTHKMMSSPVSFVSAQQPAAVGQPAWQANQQQQEAWPNDQRRLEEEDGNMVQAMESSDKEVEIPMSEVHVASDDHEEDEEHTTVKTSRRLGQNPYGYTPSNINFQDKMAELHPICTRKPLRYKIGAGIFFRAKLHNFEIPSGTALGALAPLANLAQFADMDTHNIALANTALGVKIANFFPKALCDQGVCDGVLPGCPGQTIHTLLIPQVEFKMNRKFKWNKKTQKSAKEATAYAMALTPEIIRVTSILITSLLHSTTPPPGSINHPGANCRWTKSQDCSDEFQYRGTEYQGCSVEDHKNQGWCSVDRIFHGNWRNCYLTCQNSNGGSYTLQNYTDATYGAQTTPIENNEHKGFDWGKLNPFAQRRLSEEEQEEESAPESDRFLAEFEPEALQYKVDEDFIHHLTRRNAFRGLEDGREAELGPLKVVSFHVHKGDTTPGKAEMIPVGVEEKFEWHASFIQPPVSLPITTLTAGATILGITILIAGFFRMSKRSTQVLPYVAVDEQAPVE